MIYSSYSRMDMWPTTQQVVTLIWRCVLNASFNSDIGGISFWCLENCNNNAKHMSWDFVGYSSFFAPNWYYSLPPEIVGIPWTWTDRPSAVWFHLFRTNPWEPIEWPTNRKGSQCPDLLRQGSLKRNPHERHDHVTMFHCFPTICQPESLKNGHFQRIAHDKSPWLVCWGLVRGCFGPFVVSRKSQNQTKQGLLPTVTHHHPPFRNIFRKKKRRQMSHKLRWSNESNSNPTIFISLTLMNQKFLWSFHDVPKGLLLDLHILFVRKSEKPHQRLFR